MKVIRFVFALVLFLISLLAIIPAPNYDAWELSIVVTELGWIIALASLLVFLPGWWRTALGRLAAGLGFAAFVLSLSPILRALPIARALPSRLQTAFGDTTAKSLPGAAARSKSFVGRDWIIGIHKEKVRHDSFGYLAGDGERLGIDLYRPLNSGEALPLVVMIHGGSWRGGTRAELAALNPYLAARGYAVASIDYRLAPKFPHPAASQDVDRAIRFLKANSSQLQLDPSRIVLVGRSAGGQLALLHAYTANDPSIRGVVAFYAPSDQNYGYEHPSNPRVINSIDVLEKFLAGNPKTVPAAYHDASPVNFVSGSTPPTLLIHGVKDELVSVHQSERLDSALAQSGRSHLFLRFPWATHGCDYFINGPCGQISTYAIERFLAAVLKQN
ncbi:MAG TPA: alpha/beta hydrolase [Gemmatimonadaceae bacterium]|jgi:acetyl esterase/lipase|nr:alpha/beta hydrolase [Gemmatimonadaceae bacterium]